MVEIVGPPGTKGINLDIKDVNFICPDIDIVLLYKEMKELKEILKKLLDTKQLSQEIGNELVGETYLRWDTQVRFYPTIGFIFLESEEDFVRRSISNKDSYIKKVQIKLRITKHRIEEFVKNYVINLKSKILNLIDTYNFHAGNTRCTYVNQGTVSWKTTIFARNKKEAMTILLRLSNLIEAKVDIRMLTSSDMRLVNKEESDILVYLHKVSLLVNKKKYPIMLYHV